MNHKKGIAFAIITALLWGFLAIIIKVALQEVDAIAIVWVRMTIALLGLGFFYLFKAPSAFKIFVKPPKLLWVAAPALAVNYIAYSLGVQYAGPATAQVVIQLGAITLCLSGFFLFKEHFVKRQIVGFLLVFVGLFFFYRQQLLGMSLGRTDFVKGVVITILAALAWAGYSIAQKKLVVNYPVQQINLFLYAFASLVYLPFVDFSSFTNLPLWMWGVLLLLGLNTLVAYGTVGAALKHTDAGRVSVILILNPLITILALSMMEYWGIDWFVIEQIPLWAYFGAVVMLTGAVLAVVSPKKIKNESSK